MSEAKDNGLDSSLIYISCTLVTHATFIPT